MIPDLVYQGIMLDRTADGTAEITATNQLYQLSNYLLQTLMQNCDPKKIQEVFKKNDVTQETLMAAIGSNYGVLHYNFLSRYRPESMSDLHKRYFNVMKQVARDMYAIEFMGVDPDEKMHKRMDEGFDEVKDLHKKANKIFTMDMLGPLFENNQVRTGCKSVLGDIVKAREAVLKLKNNIEAGDVSDGDSSK